MGALSHSDIGTERNMHMRLGLDGSQWISTNPPADVSNDPVRDLRLMIKGFEVPGDAYPVLQQNLIVSSNCSKVSSTPFS